jgi:hypothetical protein
MMVMAQIPTPAQLAADLEYALMLFWETWAELEAEEVAQAAVMPGWTPQALAAHIAFWDDYQRRRMVAIVDGTAPAAGFPRPAVDNDARAQADSARPWSEVEAAINTAHAALVDFARRLDPAALTTDYRDGDRPFSALKQLQHMRGHVLEHRRELQLYLGSVARWGRHGLRRLLVEQHDNLLNAVAGLSEATMMTTPVCGVWNIRDVLAHVWGWNEYCRTLLQHWPEPDPAVIAPWAWQPGETMDDFNARLLERLLPRTIIEIADGLATEQRRILTIFDQTDEAALHSAGLTWGGPGVLSCFYYEIAVHQAEHAAQIWAFRAGRAAEEAARNRSNDS